MSKKKYKVITLCGSTKFKNEFIETQKRLSLEGNIVISVGLFGHSGDDEVWLEDTKKMLDDMHKQKIDMSDEIFVIDVNGYIGDSTRTEIEYAKSKGKPIRFYSDDSAYYDEVGGFHDGAVGWNPNGMWCGECTIASCKDCDGRHLVEPPPPPQAPPLRVLREGFRQ